MKAVQITGYGGNEVVQVNEVQRPTLEAGQVLVGVHAAGVNPFDVKVREGIMGDSLHLPATLGGDFAGVVTEIGPEADGVEVGQAVYGQANAAGGQGSWAEYAPIKVGSMAPKPESLSFTEAAAIPLVTVSAYQALVETMNLKAGQKILIHGGGGGIGSMAIQLAKHLGAIVATTAAADDFDFVKSLGAETVINYKTEDFSQKLAGYDAVYDTVGGETNAKSYLVLKPGGQLVSMVAQPDEALSQQYQVTASLQQTRTTPERLTAVKQLVDTGSLKPQIAKVFPLEAAADALDYLKSSSPRGKVVFEIKASQTR